MATSSTGLLVERAPAKVNLSLHVLGRRADGMHLLESLVVFADFGDALTFEPGATLDLAVTGPLAGEAGPLADNLVLRAARALAECAGGVRLGRFTLDKHIPVAAGLGGGSADAAAALRLVARASGIDLNDARLLAAAAATGADVPVCLEPRPALMRGTGDEVARLDLPPLFGVLVNPGVAVATGAVFAALGLRPGEARPGTAHPRLAGAANPQELLRRLADARNDLAEAAQGIAPDIGLVMDALRVGGADIVRMSGSGATVVGLVPDLARARAIAAQLAAERPAWWIEAVGLGAPPVA